jgi:hypothetical protein
MSIRLLLFAASNTGTRSGTLPTDAIDLVYGNGVYCGLKGGQPGTSMTSTNGINWQAINNLPGDATTWWGYLAFGNGTFVAIPYGGTVTNCALSSVPFWNDDGLLASGRWHPVVSFATQQSFAAPV